MTKSSAVVDDDDLYWKCSYS